MGNDYTRDDDWGGFDFSRWGYTPESDEGKGGAADDHSHTNHAASSQDSGQADHQREGLLRPALADGDDTVTSSGHHEAGHWETRGGVMRWQPERDDEAAEEDAPLREEAQSPWASEDVDLPLGAPATARLRAIRAWLARRRQSEMELIGELLLERRRLAGSQGDEDERPESPENPNDPLALALAEAQGAADEYETLLGLLEDIRAHTGPQAALVEFYLSVSDRVAALATHPAAPSEIARSPLSGEVARVTTDDEPTPAMRSEWQGRAGAALAARRRVERVNATEPEDD